MWTFAWRNLMTRPLRTILGLVGLSIPILGFLGLFSLSNGLRGLVEGTLDQIQGVMVQRENVLSPILSDLPSEYVEKIRALPGVKAVAPEVWAIAPPLDGSPSLISRTARALATADTKKRMQSLLETVVICGQDIPAHEGLASAVYPKKLLPPDRDGGRFLKPDDAGSSNVVISKKIAGDFPHKEKDGSERPKRPGDPIRIGEEEFQVVGIYDTESMLLDSTIVMDIGTARRFLRLSPDLVSSIYVEGVDPSKNEELSERIEKALPLSDAREMSEFMGTFAALMENFDWYLLGIVSLALLVGVVGIVNTMLMSTTERFTEFGVLRTNGWSQLHVLKLVTIESAYLGLLSGLIACGLGLAAISVANLFLSGGLRLAISPGLLAGGLLISVGVAVLGGFYPASRAAKMAPMDAIRVGGH